MYDARSSPKRKWDFECARRRNMYSDWTKGEKEKKKML
jgi:hypothetical protein